MPSLLLTLLAVMALAACGVLPGRLNRRGLDRRDHDTLRRSNRRHLGLQFRVD